MSITKRTMSRRGLFQSAALLSAGYAFHASRAGAADPSPLSVAWLSWIPNIHPAVQKINAELNQVGELEYKSLASTDADMVEFVIGEEPIDVIVGVTPFLEMSGLIEAGLIEPWDSYVGSDLLADLPDSVRQECTADGQLYALPFVQDVVAIGSDSSILRKLDLEPDQPLGTWGEVIEQGDSAVNEGITDHGCVYLPVLWDSLIPIALSISPDVWRDDGVFAWTSDPAVEALEILARMTDVTQMAFTDTAFCGVMAHNYTVDESKTWGDDSDVVFFGLPGPDGNPSRTTFWNTSAVLLASSEKKQEAADYMTSVVKDPRVWEANFTGLDDPNSLTRGQLPPLQSIWDWMEEEEQELLAGVPWAQPLWEYGIEFGVPIPATPLNWSDYEKALPSVSEYLNGTESDPLVALQNAETAIDEVLATL